MKTTNILLLFLAILTIGIRTNAQTPQQKVNIVFIGNSITAAKPPQYTSEYLMQKGYDVKFANCGVSGATTVDFSPETNKYYPNVILAADSLYKKEGVLIFSIMLGTNDSAIKGPNGSPVSPKNYNKNLATIVNDLLLRYPQSKVVLQRPIWYSPNTHNSALYLQEGLDRLQSYFPEIKGITKSNTKIYEGDTKAFNFFKKNYLKYHKPEQGNSGIFYLHPNDEGAHKLADFWAISLEKVIQKL